MELIHFDSDGFKGKAKLAHGMTVEIGDDYKVVYPLSVNILTEKGWNSRYENEYNYWNK